MSRDEIVRAHADAVTRHGAWTANNIHLGEGVFTMGPAMNGVAEARVERVTQVVSDLFHGDLAGARVLDLGCYEGSFSIELARRGADVVGIDAREAHVERARFAAECLDIGPRARFELGDVRDIGPETHGEFDIVLCLGLLYHLDFPDVFDVAVRLAACGRVGTVLETQTALAARERVEHQGREYRGIWYDEGTTPGASVGNRRSFWPTKASLINLLGDAGFTSVTEVLLPVIPDLAAYRDHVTLVALTGTPLQLESVPGFSSGERYGNRWPKRLTRAAHPAQGRRWALLERARRRRGAGLAKLFTKG